ncbi:hypothetical protein ACIRU2_08225 [Streptomyces sp. NPDC101169]|uniref:hypothetical protein n=1 Tax=unclassified Streptomyces TaxID=2593676 RepID=UPI0037F9B3DE
MISTRRIVAAVGLAAGFAGLAAPMASAADKSAPERISPLSAVDSLATTGIPDDQQGQLPKVSEQLGGLNQLGSSDGLGQLGGLTDLVAPATGLLPGL